MLLLELTFLCALKGSVCMRSYQHCQLLMAVTKEPSQDPLCHFMVFLYLCRVPD